VTLQHFARQVSGRESRIVPVSGTEQLFPCDKVIIAVGQKPFAASSHHHRDQDQ